MKMVLCLSFSGHEPNIFVEGTQEDLDKINKLSGRGYLFDSEPGRKFIEELCARPHLRIPQICVYC